jgi:hypothetical protein
MRPILLLALALPALLSAAPPTVKVGEVRRIFHNGEHNAFTDLCRFRGQLYLTFRSCPDGHMVHPTASVIILRSADEGKTWTPAHRFSVKDRDTRDPHFLVFRDRLFVYSGDGTNWSEPEMLEGTFGHYIWRAATHDGKAYLCGRRKPGFEIGPRGEGEKVQSLLLESEDGLIWKKRAFFNEQAGDETAFLFEPDGTLLGIGRHGGGKNAFLLRSSPPYRDWSRESLDRPIGGPLVAKWGAHVLVGGRKTTKEHGPKTSLCWLVDGALREFAELPSSGDNSYPGFVTLAPDRALVSWYSSHEKDESGKTITAIYLTDLTLTNP